MRFRIAICLESLRLPLRQGTLTAARLGATGVELEARGELAPRNLSRTGRRQLRKSLDDVGLQVACVSFRTRRGYEIDDEIDRRVQATKEAMTLAYDLGASVVSNSIGQVAESEEDPTRQILTESLLELGRHGQTCGAWLAARTGSTSGPLLSKFLDTLPDGSVGIDFDPAALSVNGHAVDEALTALAPRIIHVHARDAARDLAVGRGMEVTLGRGSVDFFQLAATLDQRAYRGYFTIDRREARDPVREAGDAVKFLQALRGS
ncbi:MAG TPA: sugar phosphate isomerase/epimerase family protein [Pirellulaceae bacterium]